MALILAKTDLQGPGNVKNVNCVIHPKLLRGSPNIFQRKTTSPRKRLPFELWAFDGTGTYTNKKT
jgi:hypothetical protein